MEKNVVDPKNVANLCIFRNINAMVTGMAHVLLGMVKLCRRGTMNFHCTQLHNTEVHEAQTIMLLLERYPRLGRVHSSQCTRLTNHLARFTKYFAVMCSLVANVIGPS